MLGILFLFLGPPASWLFLTFGLGVIFECNRDAGSAFPYLYEERNPGWLKYIGDEIVPSYIGIIVNHYKDPHKTTRIQRKVFEFFFFVAHSFTECFTVSSWGCSKLWGC